MQNVPIIIDDQIQNGNGSGGEESGDDEEGEEEQE
jgi:hypothetical protein